MGLLHHLRTVVPDDNGDVNLIQPSDHLSPHVFAGGTNGQRLEYDSTVSPDKAKWSNYTPPQTQLFLGGNKELITMKSGNVIERINNALVFRINWDRPFWVYNVIAELRTTNAGTSIQPQVWRLAGTGGGDAGGVEAGLGVAITATSVDFEIANQLQIIPILASTGIKWYVVRGIRNNLANETYMQAYLEGIPT